MSLQEDPTIQLCLVKNTFRERNLDIETVEAIKPRPYNSEDVENLDLNIETVADKGQEPDSMIDPKGYSELKILKDRLGRVDSSIIRSTNPFESIGRSIFMSRAGVKLANIDAVFSLSGFFGNIHSYQSDDTITFCDIAGGPGAFSQYLFWRRPESSGFGITLRNAAGLDWDLEGYRFTPFYGTDGDDGQGTGNLYTNWESFRDYILEKNSDGTDMAVADGGFDVGKSKDYNRQEFLSSRLIAIEFYLGFMCIKKNRNFVCKVFDTVTKFMYDIIYLLSLAFEEIVMFKPMSSRPANSERYLVCINRKEDLEIPARAFEDIILSFTDELYVSKVLDKLPRDYISWMDEQNILSMERQFKYINYAISASLNEEIEMSLYNNHKALLLWNLPGNIEKKRGAIAEIKDNLLATNYDRADLYNYPRVEDFLKSPYFNEFPWKRLYYTDEDVIEMFYRLKAYSWRSNIYYMTRGNFYTIKNIDMEPRDLKYKGIQEIIIGRPEEYLRFRILSDTFPKIEQSRLQTVIIGTEESAWDFYYGNREKIAQNALVKFGKITPHTMRESLYQLGNEVSTFRPNLVVAIAQMFKIDSMLDFSAGWGDRLIGAMASGISYVGVDPNMNNKEGYEDIINFFSGRPELDINRDNYKIILDPIEDADLSSVEPVDLVMTSPPYFNLEIYSTDPTQSTSRYKTEKSWFDNFLAPAIDKTLAKLNDSGYLVLVINQKSRTDNYIRKMLAHVTNLKNMEYLGVISYGNKKGKTEISNPQPMWIWRKNGSMLFLVDIDNSMRYELSRIVLDPDNMKNIGTGKPWTKDKLFKFIHLQSESDPDYFWKGIEIDGRIEGLIGIHPVRYGSGENKFFVTIFLHKYNRKKGFGATSLNYILDLFSKSRPDVKEVYADILVDNIPAQKLFNKMGFIFTENVTINENKYNRYVFRFKIISKLTYLTAFEVLSDKIYDEKLSDWEKLSLNETIKRGYADLIATEGKYSWDKSLYKIRADLKFRIDAHLATNKVDLHRSLSEDETTKNIIAETYIITPESDINIENMGVWIWRPENGFGGSGISIVNSQVELDMVRQSFAGKRAILSKYIVNPMLIDGRKFHLRIMFFVLVTENEVVTYVSKYGRIATAEKQFELGDFNDTKIHDTHLGDKNLLYPYDFPYQDSLDKIDDQIEGILSLVTREIGPTFRKYNETKAGYDILGCDFMIDTDGNVILIEINGKPGFRGLNEKTNAFMSEVLGSGIIGTIINPYFKGTEPNEEDAIFIGRVNLQ